MLTQTAVIDDVERWNDTFALEHDIDDYYERSGPAIRFVESRRHRIIERMVAAAPNDRILEIGCGGGHVLRLFPKAELTGVDVSGVFLAKARKNLKGYRVTLLKGEIDEVGLEAASFDKAVCSEVLEHVVDPERVLTGLRRLVRPGGTIVLTFPNDRLINGVKSLIRYSGARILPPFRRIGWGGDKYHLHVWAIPQMRELLGRFFTIASEAFAPTAMLPLRCCFRCRNDRPGG